MVSGECGGHALMLLAVANGCSVEEQCGAVLRGGGDYGDWAVM